MEKGRASSNWERFYFVADSYKRAVLPLWGCRIILLFMIVDLKTLIGGNDWSRCS